MQRNKKHYEMASAMNSRVERRKVINSHIYTVLINNLSHQKYLKLFHFQNDLFGWLHEAFSFFISCFQFNIYSNTKREKKTMCLYKMKCNHEVTIDGVSYQHNNG